MKFKADPGDSDCRLLTMPGDNEDKVLELIIPKKPLRKSRCVIIIQEQDGGMTLYGASCADLKKMAKLILKEFER